MNRDKIKAFGLLHMLLIVYSLGGISAKLAAQQEFLSLRFILYYGIVLIILGGYAILWQQILKRLPLITVYANKAVTVIWGIVWGRVFFHEQVSVLRVFGALIIIFGVFLVVSSENDREDKK